MRTYKEKECLRCKKIFTPKSPAQKYCTECAKEAYREYDRARGQARGRKPWGKYNQKGKANNNYKNGIGRYQTALPKEKCELCGSTKYLLIHHRDQDRSNNVDENLQVLCKRCHQNIHCVRDEITGRFVKQK